MVGGLLLEGEGVSYDLEFESSNPSLKHKMEKVI